MPMAIWSERQGEPFFLSTPHDCIMLAGCSPDACSCQACMLNLLLPNSALLLSLLQGLDAVLSDM